MCRFHLKLVCDYSVRDHGLIRISLLRHMNSISLQILNSLVKTHHIFPAIISIKITQLYTGKNLLRASLESLGFWSILSQLVQLGKESGQKSSFNPFPTKRPLKTFFAPTIKFCQILIIF